MFACMYERSGWFRGHDAAFQSDQRNDSNADTNTENQSQKKQDNRRKTKQESEKEEERIKSGLSKQKELTRDVCLLYDLLAATLFDDSNLLARAAFGRTCSPPLGSLRSPFSSAARV